MNTRVADARPVGSWSRQFGNESLGFAGGDTNLYRSVRNSPTMFVDPDGRAATKPPLGDEQIASIIQQVLAEMEKEKWQPPLTATGRPDPGAFGKEVHARASKLLKKLKGWYVDVYVENGTNKVLSIGERPQAGVTGTTQVDAICVKGSLKVGDVIDPSKVNDIYDIKTGASGGRMSPEQKSRLQDILNFKVNKKVTAQLKPLTSPKLFDPRRGIVDNPRYALLTKVFGLASGLGAVYAMFHMSDYDGELDDIQVASGQLKNERNSELAKLKAIEVLSLIVNYLGHFMPSSELDVIKAGEVYRILGK